MYGQTDSQRQMDNMNYLDEEIAKLFDDEQTAQYYCQFLRYQNQTQQRDIYSILGIVNYLPKLENIISQQAKLEPTSQIDVKTKIPKELLQKMRKKFV